MALPFYIAAMTGDRATRTHISHVARGIAFMLTTPTNKPIYNHPNTLPFALGLATHIRWYAEKPRKLPDFVACHIMHHASQHWTRSLLDLDLLTIHLNLAALKTDEHIDMVLKLLTPILNQQMTHKEKFNIMNLLLPHAIPAEVLDKLTMSMASLEAALTSADPMLPTHLRSIHSLLITYPESVTLLTDTEVAKLIDGAEIMTKTQIVKASNAKAAGSRKKVTADDL